MKKIKDITLEELFKYCEQENWCGNCPIRDMLEYSCQLYCHLDFLKKHGEEEVEI